MEEKKKATKMVPITIYQNEQKPSDNICTSFHKNPACRENGDNTAPGYMIEREFEILAEMRRTKNIVSQIKENLKDVEKLLKKSDLNKENQDRGQHYFYLPTDGDGQRLTEKRHQLYYWLKRLKEEWRNLDNKRIEAAEERMRLLGHID